ncbi:MAG: hypothetical protein ACI8WT_000215 [Clostridium sp.]
MLAFNIDGIPTGTGSTWNDINVKIYIKLNILTNKNKYGIMLIADK